MFKIMLRKRQSFKGNYWLNSDIENWLTSNGVKDTYLKGKWTRFNQFDTLPIAEIKEHLVIKDSKRITLELTATVSPIMQSGFYTVSAN